MYKKLIIIGLLATFPAAILSEEYDVDKEAQKASYNVKQWLGYAAQIATTAAVHKTGSTIQYNLDEPISRIFAFICQLYIAKTVQHYVSKTIFRFQKNDWANSANNYANFWGWFFTVSNPAYEFYKKLDEEELEKLLQKLKIAWHESENAHLEYEI